MSLPFPTGFDSHTHIRLPEYDPIKISWIPISFCSGLTSNTNQWRSKIDPRFSKKKEDDRMMVLGREERKKLIKKEG